MFVVYNTVSENSHNFLRIKVMSPSEAPSARPWTNFRDFPANITAAAGDLINFDRLEKRLEKALYCNRINNSIYLDNIRLKRIIDEWLNN